MHLLTHFHFSLFSFLFSLSDRQRAHLSAAAGRPDDSEDPGSGGRLPLRQLSSDHQQRGDRVLRGQQEGVRSARVVVRATLSPPAQVQQLQVHDGHLRELYRKG